MRLFSRLLPALKSKLVIPSVGVLALVVFASFIIFEATQATVVVAQDGKTETVKTHAKTVKELLEELGITVGKHDALSFDLDATIENGMEIEYKQAKHILVTIDDDTYDYYTTVQTVGEFLNDEQLLFSHRDDMSHDVTEEIKDGLHLMVTQAYQVTIDDGGKEKQVWTTGGSVKELLKEHDVTLKKDDKIKPALDEDVLADTDIIIVRVKTETDTIEETIAFDTETKEDHSLEKGKEKVISEGQNGTVVKTYEVTFENGEEVDRKLISEEVEAEPTNKVVAVGTKETELVTLSKPKESSNHNNNNSSTKEFTMTATAYTANCNGCSGITATGINLLENPDIKVIAVDPNVIPLGSKVWVEGYGNAIAGDTGGSIVGNKIDVHVPTKADAHAFGMKKVKVKILD